MLIFATFPCHLYYPHQTSKAFYMKESQKERLLWLNGMRQGVRKVANHCIMVIMLRTGGQSKLHLYHCLFKVFRYTPATQK